MSSRYGSSRCTVAGTELCVPVSAYLWQLTAYHFRSGVNAAAEDGGPGEARPTAVAPRAHRWLGPSR